jgi:diadenosine tetraphosphatase ApaH/serine/threonine PP2A family protein phosphatase
MIALVSDIHGNLEALRAVFGRIAPDERVACLGDIVGYGPDPNACLALVRERAAVTVLGNHDVGAIDNHGIEFFNQYARTAIEWTQGVLDAGHGAWLDSLSYEARIDDYLLVHGAPIDYFTYLLDVPAAERAFDATDAALIFVGHTHVAGYFARSATGAVAWTAMPDGGLLDLDPAARYVVNVGSVGQPRDRNNRASFCRFDPVARRITWERVPYPLAQTQAKMQRAALPEALVRRLEAGR